MSYIRERSKELTGYQEAAAWSPEIDLQCDFVMVYGLDETTGERIEKFREKGYVVHLMTGISWGSYQDYLDGSWDGRNHWDESQMDRDGNYILHGIDTPYMVPTIAFADYLTQKLKTAVDAGVEAIHLEEPEFWDYGGYSEAFKREYRLHYREDWQPPHTSVDVRYKASKLKAYLYARTLDRIGSALKEYAMTRFSRVLRFYVPTHSLLNYTQWKIMSPEAALTDLPCVDGYIAQIWTGTSRAVNVYEGVARSRTFETAFLEYGVMQELVQGTGRRMWFLHDPIEDNPEHTWEDYRRNYIKTVAASLLHPGIHTYEICPWPTRVMHGIYPQRAGMGSGMIPAGHLPGAKRIPPEYASLLCGMIQMLGDMEQTDCRFEGFEENGVGILTADSGLFQRTYPDSYVSPDLVRKMDELLGALAQKREGAAADVIDADESRQYRSQFLAFQTSGAYPGFYGLAMPLVKYGLPLRPVQLDHVRRFPGYLNNYQTLILSYEIIKPGTPDCNAALAGWVRDGGTLIYVGDGSDPYHQISAWWNQTEHPYRNPAEHLFEALGLSREPEEGIYSIGKGRLAIRKEAPAHICLSKENANRFRDFVRRILKESGWDWRYTNYFLLHRGPYRICSVMEESISNEPKVLRGLFADMLKPDYPIITKKAVHPDESAILYDLSRIGSESVCIIGTSARILSMNSDERRTKILMKAAGGIRVWLRIRLAKAPTEIDMVLEDGNPVEAEWSWDEQSQSVLVSYQSRNQAVVCNLYYKET